MKMTINKLIANDIINYGMSQTSNFDYSVYLDSYIDDYDLESQNYILNNLEDICSAISKNENISYFNYNKENKEFDMVFYWNNLMNDTEKYVYDIISDLRSSIDEKVLVSQGTKVSLGINDSNNVNMQ